MHPSVLAWGERVVRERRLSTGTTLEVGSLDVNGSLRPLFTGPYTGVDFRDGPGVDLVANGHALPFDDDVFSVVVCTEVLEHDDAFWLTMAEIGRVLAPGGELLLSTRGNGYPEHSYPDDLWRFMPSSAAVLAAAAGLELAESLQDEEDTPGILLVAVKP